MRVNTDARLPQNDDLTSLKQRLYETHREIATQVNLISEGYLRGASNAAAAMPTSGTYAQGDFVRNSAPLETGTAGSKFVVIGWLNTVAGSPGTFVQCRYLTGN